MDPAAGYQETLRRPALFDESAVEQHAGLGLGLRGAHLLDAKTAELAFTCTSGNSPGRKHQHGTTQAPSAVIRM